MLEVKLQKKIHFNRYTLLSDLATMWAFIMCSSLAVFYASKWIALG